MPHIIDLHFLGYPKVIAAFLVETEDGPVLIETGPYSTYPTLEKGVNRIGYSIKDIKHVLLTHIHLDHAGAAWKLAENGANIYVHPVGMAHLAYPSKLMDSAKRIYKEDMDRLWGDMQAIPQSQLHEVS
ncbi:MAG: MBL fold metallo-hydrolase, partial [Cyclobacteriaceae bacterium]